MTVSTTCVIHVWLLDVIVCCCVRVLTMLSMPCSSSADYALMKTRPASFSGLITSCAFGIVACTSCKITQNDVK